jgi:hypothetical protein
MPLPKRKRLKDKPVIVHPEAAGASPQVATVTNV